MKKATEDFLKHYGVLGMRWGHRKESSGGSSTSHPAHPDSVLARAAETKLKSGGVHTLSNHELQALANRRNLEQRVRTSTPRNRVLRGSRTVTKILNSPEAQISMKIVRSQLARKALATGAAAGIIALRRAR